MYKIFIGLAEAAGYCTNLKKGFQDIGIECVFINLSDHPFKYGGDNETNALINALISLYKSISKSESKFQSKWIKKIFYVFQNLIEIPIFLWAVTNYNVFIFNSESFFRNHDLRILKFFNKKIIFLFMGTDIRPPYINSKSQELSLNEIYLKSRKTKSKIIAVEKFADVVISHPGYGHFHQKTFIKFLSIGIPFVITQEILPPKKRISKSVIILHSPSDPVGKGTDQIRAAIRVLQEKGYDLKYIEITGMSNQAVIESLQLCDFVIDQIYSDTPMARFATEAAWFGKPAIVGGYYSNYIQNDYEPNVIPPSEFCHPEQIESALEKLLVNPDYRQELGRKAQEFVQRQWALKEIVQRYMQVIEGSIPDEWFFNPYDIQYLQGYGNEHRTKEVIRALIERYGIDALCLSDKTDLENKFRDFSKNFEKKL